jgi:hypothetical protein
MYSKTHIQMVSVRYRALCATRADILKREGHSPAYWKARAEELFFYDKHGSAIRKAFV